MIVRGDKLTFNEYASSLAANLIETKILLNSTIYNAKRRSFLMSSNIKNNFTHGYEGSRMHEVNI